MKMNLPKEVIKRIKKGDKHIIFFPDDCKVYQNETDETEFIIFNAGALLAIAKKDISHLLIISKVVYSLVNKLEMVSNKFEAIETQNKRSQNGSQATS